MNELMAVLGLKYDNDKHSFNFNGQDFQINVDAMTRNWGYRKKSNNIENDYSSESNSNMAKINIGGLSSNHNVSSLKYSDRFKHAKLNEDFYKVNKSPHHIDLSNNFDQRSFLGNKGIGII